MKGYWHYDGTVYSAFDEAESKWPSLLYISIVIKQSYETFDLLGFCLVVRANGIVGFRW